VDRDAARRSFSEIRESIESLKGRQPEKEVLLEGFRRIADERMAEAIRRVSVRRGFAPADHALLAFGGAGGQHACAVAEILEVREVLVPPDAGLLSAVGLGAARLERVAAREILDDLAEAEGRIRSILGELEREAGEELAFRRSERDPLVVPRRLAYLRFRGQDEKLEIAVPGAGTEAEGLSDEELVTFLRREFQDRYRELYGYLPPERDIELVTLRVVVGTEPDEIQEAPSVPVQEEAAPAAELRARFGGRWLEVPVFDRVPLMPGEGGTGPAVVREVHGTTVVDPGWRWRVDGNRALFLERAR
ncbi:MAG: hydantoinase/oxoprolinase family protein, partial [Thermoanaerobaculia bacterium]|nr:hydantoinase/oxoprolinase family protein [Thermoanaerobaculia bacterium]